MTEPRCEGCVGGDNGGTILLPRGGSGANTTDCRVSALLEAGSDSDRSADDADRCTRCLGVRSSAMTADTSEWPEVGVAGSSLLRFDFFFFPIGSVIVTSSADAVTDNAAARPFTFSGGSACTPPRVRSSMPAPVADPPDAVGCDDSGMDSIAEVWLSLARGVPVSADDGCSVRTCAGVDTDCAFRSERGVMSRVLSLRGLAGVVTIRGVVL